MTTYDVMDLSKHLLPSGNEPPMLTSRQVDPHAQSLAKNHSKLKILIEKIRLKMACMSLRPFCPYHSELLYPRSTEGGMGVYWIHPDVCPSVRPSVDKVSGTFWKNYCSIHFIHGVYPYGVGLLTSIRFLCSLPHLWPSGGHKFGRKWGFRNFLKKQSAQFISYLAFILMEWVSWPLYIFVFLASFRPSGG